MLGGSDTRSDAELLRATDAEPEAFAAFYRRHAAWLLGVTMARLRSAELAADVVSETFAAALLYRGRFDPRRGDARSWLSGIARNEIGTAARRGAAEDRARRRLEMEPVPLEPEDEAWIEGAFGTGDEGVFRAGGGDKFHGEDEEALRGDRAAAAIEALAALPADQRELLEARVLDERPYRELARERRLTEAAVRKRVSRGLAVMRTRLRAAGIQR